MADSSAGTTFEPRIIAFLCNWCTYRGADLAGTSRLAYPDNVRIIRVMCTGSVDPVYILKALLDGADGVLVGGCHPGDCHYQTGNFKAARKMEILESVLGTTGVDAQRVWLRWISASEGTLFRETITEMVEFLKTKGPNPLRRSWALWQKSKGMWRPAAINGLTQGEQT